MKDAGELEQLRRAAAISDRVFEELGRAPFVGRTEAELAWWIEQAWHEAGADGASFAPAVAAGENGAAPAREAARRRDPGGHARRRRRRLHGRRLRSDCTRTFFTGEPTGRLREVYALCLTGAARRPRGGRTRCARARRRRGVAGRDRRRRAWASATATASATASASTSTRLPTLRPESDSVLVTGNVVTVEPGLYLPGEFGVRIEDMVVVTDDGCERLTTVTKEPVQVG